MIVREILVMMLTLVVATAMTHTTIVYATNESSYRIGYSKALDDFGCTYPKSGEGCAPWYPNNETIPNTCYSGNHGGSQYIKADTYAIDNSTSCEDGYAAGFAYWCKTDASDCADQLKDWLSKVPPDHD